MIIMHVKISIHINLTNLPSLYGHNVQALSKLKHVQGRRREILQRPEEATYADDMTNC